MKKSRESTKKLFYKTNPSRGISLIVLVITIIVVIILAAAVIISLQNNNPMTEANKARINSDVANMQAIFTNTVSKIMAENQDVVQVEDRQLNSVTSGQKKTTGETIYKILGEDGHVVVEGSIIFGVGQNAETTYYTGKELPIYSSETKWRVDNQGLLSVEVGGVAYGEGSKSDNPPLELKEEIEIAESDNPMLQSFVNSSDRKANYHAEEYRTKISKIKFAISDKVPGNRIEAWDVSDAKNKSVMAWIEDDKKGGYILTIASRTKIIANEDSTYAFYNFNKVESIEDIQILDTSKVKKMWQFFRACSSLTRLDLSSFDTSNVTMMPAMFMQCSNLKELNLSSFDTSNVTDMTQMFYECNSLTNLDISNFNANNLIGVQGMFYNCYLLENLNLGENFNFTKVNDMQNMFYGCNHLSTTINFCRQASSTLLGGMLFKNAATVPPAKIVINYNSITEVFVDNFINNKGDSNLVKGIKLD